MSDTALVISVIGGAIAILAAVIKVVIALAKLRDDYKGMADKAEKNDKAIKVLIKADFAILDGLKQLKCNGKVTEMHQTLLTYVVDE